MEEAVSGKARDARWGVRRSADEDAPLSPEEVARRCGLSRKAVCDRIFVIPPPHGPWGGKWR
jgi:hypothetical protein